ncbi:uncharacterized protein C8Q71DRAFT_386029 [Rhodofomes roseus]|uniref:Uncharacterized protein n=1 Tax=Rhodofomes roseus TaxID=34475 RepID=A0ABQ8K0L9_9APHY|nr:uncharacterized protein C8Q71DRAFT_386029 [Rhodofomes roseus]KAH9830002.1 hypothetical protein C8Q71DRAFT_386029 [Rhodofomes roseus]
MVEDNENWGEVAGADAPLQVPSSSTERCALQLLPGTDTHARWEGLWILDESQHTRVVDRVGRLRTHDCAQEGLTADDKGYGETGEFSWRAALIELAQDAGRVGRVGWSCRWRVGVGRETWRGRREEEEERFVLETGRQPVSHTLGEPADAPRFNSVPATSSSSHLLPPCPTQPTYGPDSTMVPLEMTDQRPLTCVRPLPVARRRFRCAALGRGARVVRQRGLDAGRWTPLGCRAPTSRLSTNSETGAYCRRRCGGAFACIAGARSSIGFGTVGSSPGGLCRYSTIILDEDSMTTSLPRDSGPWVSCATRTPRLTQHRRIRACACSNNSMLRSRRGPTSARTRKLDVLAA